MLSSSADPLGCYTKDGLKVALNRTAGWAVVRDKTLAGEFDPRTCSRRCPWPSPWASVPKPRRC